MPDSVVKLESPREEEALSTTRLIGIGLVTRVWADTAVQMFFTFLPVIAAGLGTTVIVLGRLVSLRSAMGLLSPAFGVLADRRGYRPIMRLGLLLGAVGYLVVAFSSHILVTAVGMVLAGLGTFSFIPTLQAYISSRLPYHRRARGLGILEYGWALSGIVGLFLVGQLMETAGWRAPLVLLSGGLLVAAWLYGRLPAARASREDVLLPGARLPRQRGWQVRHFLDLGANGRSAWASLLVALLTMFAAMNVFINYGTWLAHEYDYGAAALGSVALGLGLTDLTASVLVSLAGDRFGKRRAVLWGTTVAIAAYSALPLLNRGVALALVSLAVARFWFEFTLVATIPLVSEQLPANRGKMLTLMAAAALMGSSLAGFSGPWLYAQYGLAGLAQVSAATMLAAWVTINSWVREVRPTWQE